MSTHRLGHGTESCKAELSTCTREYTEFRRPQVVVEAWLPEAQGVPVTAVVGALDAVTGVVAGDGSEVPPTAGRWGTRTST